MCVRSCNFVAHINLGGSCPPSTAHLKTVSKSSRISVLSVRLACIGVLGSLRQSRSWNRPGVSLKNARSLASRRARLMCAGWGRRFRFDWVHYVSSHCNDSIYGESMRQRSYRDTETESERASPLRNLVLLGDDRSPSNRLRRTGGSNSEIMRRRGLRC